MRYPVGDLAILSAEIYTPGHGYGRPSMPKKTPPPPSTRGSEEGPRKRARVQPSIDSVERDDEEKKRARGRPRLDVKDETAADVSCLCTRYGILMSPSICLLLPSSS